MMLRFSFPRWWAVLIWLVVPAAGVAAGPEGPVRASWTLPVAELPRIRGVGECDLSAAPDRMFGVAPGSGGRAFSPRPESAGARSTAPAAGRGSHWRRLWRLEDYNTRIVLLGTGLLGLASGVIGSFTLLRRRALVGDALSHAMLPGLAIAFLLAVGWGHSGRSLPLLLSGAAVSGLLGMAVILLIRHGTRLHEDTALGIVLGVFFGAGVALLGVVQQMPAGHAAGLEDFIFGKTASMVARDAWLIGAVAFGGLLICLLLFKELRLLSFDDQYARAKGFPVVALDVLLIGLVVLVTIVGLQAVGLVLMIALLIIPAAAARFWTERMDRMTGLAAGIGAFSSLMGASLSALFPQLPSGATIVLVAAGLFFGSMLLAPSRGVLARVLRRRRLERMFARQHLLRALDASRARHGAAGWSVTFETLLAARSWSARSLRRELRRARRAGWVERRPGDGWCLTVAGASRAARLTREHRLWELYLLTHADVAAGRVDHRAEMIEEVLDPQTLQRLEAMLAEELGAVPEDSVPPGPLGAVESPRADGGA